MSSNRNTRNVKTRARSSEGLDLDDSHIIEERLKNLLTNVKERDQPRNIFNNVQEVPKLRRSVVARAVQNVVCSTPMPKGKKSNFFCSENSLNISPIDPILEDAELNEDKKGKTDKQNENPQCDKEVTVILTRTRVSLPVVISDSEDEREVQSILQGEKLDLSEKVDDRVHHNTRSTDNKKLQNDQNLGVSGTDKPSTKRPDSRNTLSTKENKSLQPKKRTNRTSRTKQTELDLLKSESVNKNATDRAANLKLTPHKSPKSNSNLKNQENVEPNSNTTVPYSNETSFNNFNEVIVKITKEILKPSNYIDNQQDNCIGAEPVTQSNKTSDRLQENVDTSKNKTDKETTDQSEMFIIKTRSQNLSIRNKSGKEAESSNKDNDGNEPITFRSENSKVSTGKRLSKSRDIQSVEKLKENLPESSNTQKDQDINYQKKMSSRKLSFASNEDKCKENAAESAKLSKIPISRSGSRSRERNIDKNLKNVGNVNVDSLETRTKENSCHSVKPPPERPPRKKKTTRKQWPIGNPSKDKKDTSENVQEKVADIAEAEVNENPVNKEKTLVEIGTSPIMPVTSQISNITKLSSGAVEAGTSTRNSNIQTTTDKEKVENLNQLISKLSQRFHDSLTPSDNIASDAESQKNNLEPPPDCPNERVQIVTVNKEVQTSGKGKGPTRTKKKASKIDELPKKILPFDQSSDQSKSFLSTDHSDVLKEMDKLIHPHVLFQSLEEELNANFSSSDDEALDDCFVTNPEKRPWRLETNSQMFPNSGSGIKLNFLRSTQEIENDRVQSDSETEGARNADKKTRAKKSKLQIYSRMTQYADEKISGRLQSAGTNARLSSPISDLVLSESNSEQPKKQNKETLLPNNTPQSMETNSTKSPGKSNNEAMEKTLVQSNENGGDKNSNIPLTAKSNKNRILTAKSNEEKTTSIYCTRLRSNVKSVNKQKSPSFQKNFDYLGENEDEEVLAVPLEDTNPPVVEQASASPAEHTTEPANEPDKITNSGAEHCPSKENELGSTTKSSQRLSSLRYQNTDASQSKNSVVDKPVKPKAQKSRRKKILSENEDGVSSTTVESGELTGLRRSGRERKVVQRRIYGAIATHSERVLQYYNGPTTSTQSTSKSSVSTFTKPRTKKTVPPKKEVDSNITKESAKGKGKRAQKKKATAVRKSKVPEPSQTISDTLTRISRQTANHDLSQVETNVTVINNIDKKTPSHAGTNSRPRKHHSERDMDSDTQMPSKRNKTPGRNESIPTEETNEHSAPHANTDAGATYNNGTSHDTEDNNFLSPLDVRPNGNFSFCGGSARDNLNSVNRAIDKDSGRSTMLKSCTFEDSHLRISKPLTGRIQKNYKKKDDVCTKISKVLSRSINNSREHEILNENTPNVENSCSAIDQTDVRSRRNSILQLKPTDSQYINLLVDNNLISMKYIERVPKFKLVADNLMVSDGLKNVKDGGSMGYLKLNPGDQKSLHIARKFALFYCVIEGEGFIQVHNKTSKINKLSTFTIPLGVEYSILNTSREATLLLSFVKMPPV